MISPSRLLPRYWPPIWSDPAFAAEAEDLALLIVGDRPPADVLALAGDTAARSQILALARDLAEVQIELRRLWKVQDDLSRDLPGDQSFMDLVVAAKQCRSKSPAPSMILAVNRYQRQLHLRLRKARRAFDTLTRRQSRSVLRLAKRLHRRVDRRQRKAKAA